MTTETGVVFLMTDKERTKDCSCQHPGCFNICRVNMFYAPAKARCPEHGGRAMTRRASGEFIEFDTQPVETVEVELSDNRKLGLLHCPICEDKPLEILACDEYGGIDFGCQGCQTIVSVVFNFKVMQMRSIPERLMPLVKEFNLRQVGTMDMSVALQLNKFGGMNKFDG